VAGALVVASLGRSHRSRHILLAALCLFCPSVFAFSLSRSFALSMLLLATNGMGLTAFFSTTNTLIQTSVEDDVRGRVMGIYALVFGAMMPFGAMEAGGLAHAIGAPATVRIGAGVCAVAGLVAYLSMRRRGPGGSRARANDHETGGRTPAILGPRTHGESPPPSGCAD
jgi:predicted MFS family arabinose efflux permease